MTTGIHINFKKAKRTFEQKICTHRLYILDEDLRMCQCKKCNQWFGCFEVLKHIAYDSENPHNPPNPKGK